MSREFVVTTFSSHAYGHTYRRQQRSDQCLRFRHQTTVRRDICNVHGKITDGHSVQVGVPRKVEQIRNTPAITKKALRSKCLDTPEAAAKNRPQHLRCILLTEKPRQRT